MHAWALTAISLLQASVADLPFFGTFTRALQFLFVERKGTTDMHNKHSVSGNTTLRIGKRAADPRCGTTAWALGLSSEQQLAAVACRFCLSAGVYSRLAQMDCPNRLGLYACCDPTCGLGAGTWAWCTPMGGA